MPREEKAIILEYLPNGYPLEKKMMPIAQAIGETNFTLLELVPRRGESLEIGEEGIHWRRKARQSILYFGET
jgi:predicted nucleic acid-binding OB-fold protein